jgi:hypothetical protein
MKTQIIHRIFLAVIALLICTNNNMNKAQTDKKAAAKNTEAKSVIAKDFSKASATLSCIYCTDEHAIPAIPEPNGDHEFHYFHLKHKDGKHNFFKAVANKIIELVYYLIVLIVYMPFKH